MAQDRKVFVGGVPQHMTQEDLYNVFTEYAPVRKAWLQKCRTTEDDACPPQNHRGFGFVIFQDAHAINVLIGNNPSRFITLTSGSKLEVKRALSSNKLGRENRSENVTFEEEKPLAGSNGRRTQLLGGGGYTSWAPNSAPVFAAAARNLGLMASEPQPAAPPCYVGGPARLSELDLDITAWARAAATQDLFHAARPRGPLEVPPLRERLWSYYRHVAPEKLQDGTFIDSVAHSYSCMEAHLDHELQKKYGVGLFDFHGQVLGFDGLQGPAKTGKAPAASVGCYAVEPKRPEQRLSYDPAVLIPGPVGLMAKSSGRLGAKFEEQEEDCSFFQYGPGMILESCLAEKSDCFLPRQQDSRRPLPSGIW